MSVFPPPLSEFTFLHFFAQVWALFLSLCLSESTDSCDTEVSSLLGEGEVCEVLAAPWESLPRCCRT